MCVRHPVLAVSREDLTPEIIEREKRIYEGQASTSGKPAQVIEKIVQGKMEKFYADVCLLEQPFVKTPEKKISDYLKEQIAKFGENIIVFARHIRLDEVTRPLVRQLIKSGTSVGANYLEANEASSKKDFRNKICISRKESNESKHWLRMLSKAAPENLLEARKLWQEAHELTLIFSKIVRTCNQN